MKILKITGAFALLTASLLFVGCGSGETKEAVTNDTHTTLSQAEMDQGSEIYFDRCAGCHGSSRKGATGPSLLPDGDGKAPATKALGDAGLRAFIENGTPGGMPEWKGIMTDAEIDLMIKFLQEEPPVIPAFGMNDIKETWKVIVPVADRPTKPMHSRNIDNYFGVIMRDAGQVAVIDGDTKEELAVLNTGFAVHILRTSATGRYIYSVGRDGRITMIDTYSALPTIVAEVRGAYDARSVDVS